MIMPNNRTFQWNSRYNTEDNPFFIGVINFTKSLKHLFATYFEIRQHSQNYVNISDFVFFIIHISMGWKVNDYLLHMFSMAELLKIYKSDILILGFWNFRYKVVNERKW